jgi:hypothetical protein
MNYLGTSTQRPLTFSSDLICAQLVENKVRYKVLGRHIILNLGQKPIIIAGSPRQSVPPLNSTIVINAELRGIEKMVTIAVTPDLAPEQIINDRGWRLFADLIEDPSDEIKLTRLFRSVQDGLGHRSFAETELGAIKKQPKEVGRFDVKVNLWFAPRNTNCLIHRYHPFMETHLQILGEGRMQKFRSLSHEDIVEEVLMSPGLTQPFFNCTKDGRGGFIYPWHQYYADTDCIWLALEFHPLEEESPTFIHGSEQ